MGTKREVKKACRSVASHRGDATRNTEKEKEKEEEGFFPCFNSISVLCGNTCIPIPLTLPRLLAPLESDPDITRGRDGHYRSAVDRHDRDVPGREVAVDASTCSQYDTLAIPCRG